MSVVRPGIEKQCMHSMTFTCLHHVTGGELQQHQRVFPVHALIVGVARHAQLPRRAALRRDLAEELRCSPCRQASQPSLSRTGSQISHNCRHVCAGGC